MKRRMWKVLSLTLMIIAGCVVASEAVTLNAIYDFTDQLDATTTSFEGLAFTDDGTLWITSAPNTGTKELLEVDLETETVASMSSYSSQGYFFNPVGLASDGNNLFLTNNLKYFGGGVYTTDTNGQVAYQSALAKSDCNEPEGAAYLNGYIYVSCEDSKNVVKLDPSTGSVVENIQLGVSVLGLGATEDSLIIGDYTNHALLIYNVAAQEVTQTISLESLFGADSDYETLAGMTYEVDVENAGNDIRSLPDPDGIAYRNGNIYMTFEHDLRVFEISLDDSSIPGTPEPGTLLLVGIGLLGGAVLKRKKRS